MSERDAGAWRTDDRFAFDSFSKLQKFSHKSSNPLIFILTTALLVLFVLGYIAYFFSFLAPLLMLLVAFRLPIFVGLFLPVAIISALGLMLSGAFFMGFGVLLAALVATVLIGIISSTSNSQNKNLHHSEIYNDTYKTV